MSKVIDLAIDNLGWIISIILFFIPPVRDFVIREFQISLDKTRDNNKANNEKKIYISKTKFDAEFKMYQDLSEKQMSAVYICGEAVMVARGMYDNISEEYKNFIERFCMRINDVEMVSAKYAPFISKEIYDKYLTLDNVISDIYKLSLFLYNDTDENSKFSYKGNNYDKESAITTIEDLQKKISESYNEINDILRNYLNTLDTIK